MSTPKRWTPELLAELAEAPNLKAFQDRHPEFSDAAIRSQHNRLRRRGIATAWAAPPPVQTDEVMLARERMRRQADRNLGLTGATVTVVDEPTDEQYEELFQLLEQADESIAALSPTQESTEFYAPDDGLPVGIAFTGDWHLGAGGVDTKRLRADLQLIGATDGLYPIGMGDYVEGVGIYNKAVSAMYSGLFNDGDLQEMACIIRARDAGGKWVAFLCGNHDEWLRRAGGLSRVARLAKQLGVNGERPPVFHQGGGTVFAHVGDQRYVIAVVHNAKGNSQLNTSNAQRRTYDSWPQWENCDVICCGHLHYNDLHIQTRKGGRCVYLRSGTAKIRDSYAADHGYLPEYGIPLVILLPDEKRVLAFRGDDFRRGVEYLGWLREQYRQRQQGQEAA